MLTDGKSSSRRIVEWELVHVDRLEELIKENSCVELVHVYCWEELVEENS